MITAAGDPSVKADSLHALAVDPASYPTDGVVFLFDDGVVRLDASGRGSRTHRQIVQVLRRQVVAGFAERRVYVNQKELRLSLGGVAANTIIDFSYTIDESEPWRM